VKVDILKAVIRSILTSVRLCYYLFTYLFIYLFTYLFIYLKLEGNDFDRKKFMLAVAPDLLCKKRVPISIRIICVEVVQYGQRRGMPTTEPKNQPWTSIKQVPDAK
jgi:hypothetical protein